MNKARKFIGGDISIAVVGVTLSLIGLIFIYSASSYSAEVQTGDAFHYVKTQAVAIFVGIILMIFTANVSVEKIEKYNYVIYIVCLILLALVFVPVIGVESYGAKRWLNLGFFTIQPSEYAKFAMVITMASFMAKHGTDTLPKTLALLGIGGAVCVLLILEPNMSITICVGAVMMIMLFVGGTKPSRMIAILLPVVAGGIALVFLEPYRVRRLLAFIDPWASPLDEGYQLIQSYYALGSGGLFGIGIGNSRQKYLFLPFAESDFILSVIGEETGLVGVGIVTLLFLFLIAKGIIVAVRSKDRFSCYLASGITAIIAVQTVMNIAVVCGAVPPTGLPLPFISAGGSSVTAYMCATGILVNLSKNAKKETLGFLESAGRYYAKGLS